MRPLPTPGLRLVVAAGSALLVAIVLALSQRGPAKAEPRPDDHGWTAGWSAAMTGPGDAGLAASGVENTTLRQAVSLSVGGHAVRVRLSHEYGDRAVRIGAVTVRADARAVPVTFGGRAEAVLPAGAERVSDPVPLRVAPDDDLTVDIYLPGPTGPLTQHRHAGSTTWRAVGDHTGGAASAFTSTGAGRLLLSGVDVESDAAAVVTLGDSLTDGVGSRPGAEHSYPARLADRMGTLPAQDALAVVNAGISGNRLFVDRDVAGASALDRFDTDVLAQPGVEVVVVFEGINDIQQTAGSVHPRTLQNAYTQLAERAHDAGVAVVGATLTPYAGWVHYTAAGEADRRRVNAWIRSSGVFDAVVDLDAAVRDPEQPSRLLPAFDAGDGLHLNDAGYAAIAAAFDLDVLRRLAVS